MEKRRIIKQIRECFEQGGKVLIFGNGGSSAEASHLAAEFISIGCPAIALNDPAVLTSLTNDMDFKNVFYKQVWALGKAGDVAIGISSSGRSENVNYALKLARALEMVAIDFPRKGKTTSEVQENQLRLIHQIYEAFK